MLIIDLFAVIVRDGYHKWLTTSTEACSLTTHDTMKWSSFENKNKALFNSFLLKRTQGSSEPVLSYIYKLVLGDNTFQQALDTIQNRLKQAAQFRSTLYSDIAPAVHETDSVSAINGSNIASSYSTASSRAAPRSWCTPSRPCGSSPRTRTARGSRSSRPSSPPWCAPTRWTC
jgi:hypothetical protein